MTFLIFLEDFFRTRLIYFQINQSSTLLLWHIFLHSFHDIVLQLIFCKSHSPKKILYGNIFGDLCLFRLGHKTAIWIDTKETPMTNTIT